MKLCKTSHYWWISFADFVSFSSSNGELFIIQYENKNCLIERFPILLYYTVLHLKRGYKGWAQSWTFHMVSWGAIISYYQQSKITTQNNTETHPEGEHLSSKLEERNLNSFVFVWFCISCLTTKSPFLNWRFFFFLGIWLPILTITLFHHLLLPYSRFILDDKHLSVINLIIEVCCSIFKL